MDEDELEEKELKILGVKRLQSTREDMLENNDVVCI